MNKMGLVYIMVNCSLYGTFLLGVFLIFRNWTKLWITRFNMRKRLKSRRDDLLSGGRLTHHLANLIQITLGKKINPKGFMKFSVMLFFLMFIVGLQSTSPVYAFAMATIVSLLPYVILRVILETRRRKGSYEGEILISEFLTQYSICHFNIYETLENIIACGKGVKISRTMLFQLLLELRSTGSPREIREATDRFAYGIDTNWSRMLANNIKLSAESGINVSQSIEDILIQLREARAFVEERKRLNSESIRMVLFLIPSLYLGTILLSTKYLELPLSNFLHNQIYTAQGFVLFFVILTLFAFNLILLEFISHQRFDF